MNRAQRAIGIGGFIMLAALGTGWAIEKGSGHSRPDGGAAVTEPTKTGDLVTLPQGPSAGGQAPTSDSSQEYDRSDLLLSQG